MSSSVDISDVKYLSFKKRPELKRSNYVEYCETWGLPEYKAYLLDAHEQGTFYLAKAVLKIHKDECNAKLSAFDSDVDVVSKIAVILCSMSHLTKTTLINGESYKLFISKLSQTFRLPAQNHIAAYSTASDGVEERPVIYLMAACDKLGGLPMIKDVAGIIENMRQYAASFPPRDSAWIQADFKARCIDNHKGSLFKPNEQGWAPTTAQRRHWTHDGKGQIVLHSRRYNQKPKHSENIIAFCDAVDARLEKVEDMPGTGKDRILPWTQTSVGFSRKPDQRKKDHASHKGADSYVKK